MNAASRVLFDEPGPRGRRRIAIGTVVISVLILLVLFLGFRTLNASGELAYAKWKPFWQQWAVKFLLEGLKGTLLVTLASGLVSFPAGALLGVGRAGRNPVVKALCTAYIEIFRSVPTLLLVYVFLFALPGVGLNVSIFWKLTVPIILINSAVIAEIVRAGIRSLDRGQSEAALALGMTTAKTMRLVVLPQAVRLVIPTLVTQLVALLKDSTLGYVVSYPELMKQANNLANNTKLLLQAFVVVSAVYVVINFALTRLATYLEHRIRTRPRARPGAGAGPSAPLGDPGADALAHDLPAALAPR
ncbi:amino acid ABC transporter permease [uncultured Friedmanniella sp.]|uniref:amino acid ABC transporter permease n=1 Tax=uncultured Friedmanniella sp. TaxID=335381 RepID=UPI0035C95F82